MKKYTSTQISGFSEIEHALQVDSTHDERYQRLLNAITLLANMEDYRFPIQGVVSLEHILETTAQRIRQITPVTTTAFFMLNDESMEFENTLCIPDSNANKVNELFNEFVDDGTFAWALNQNRAIVLESKSKMRSYVLHSISTRDKKFGMFIGLTSSTGSCFDEASHSLLSASLITCSYLLETSELHAHIYAQNEELEKQVEARTKELVAARDQAEKSARAKSDFLSNMSHEIRTPLNGVVGMLSLLKNSDLNKAQFEYVRTATNSSDTLLVLINDILDFSKIEAGKLELEHITFNLRQEADDVLGLLAENVFSKGLEINLFYDKNVPEFIVGDPTRIKQILLNLIGNAVKFTEHGEIVIRIRIITSSSGREYLRIQVKDTGIGVSKTAQNKLFDSFSQADGTTTRKYGGTGLGLAICKKLVALMQGDIKVISQEGKGSLFWFDIPLTIPDKIFSEEKLLTLNKPPNVLLIEGHDNTTKNLAVQLISLGVKSHIISDINQINKEAELTHLSTIDLCFFDASIISPTEAEQLRIALEREQSLHKNSAVALLPYGAKLPAHLNWARPLHKPLMKHRLASFISESFSGTSESNQANTNQQSLSLVFTIPTTILVVDDNEINQKVTQSILATAGAIVDFADNGLEAVEKAKYHHFDLIIMDCEMPVMDGFEATSQIRQVNDKQGVPIIAFTANVLGEIKERCQQAGMTDYLSKPVKQEDMFTVLQRWLPEHVATQQMASEVNGSNCELSEQTEAQPIIDEKVMSMLTSLMGEDEFREFLSGVVDKTSSQIISIKRAVAEGDAEQVHFISHSLKGSMGNVGAVEVSEIAHNITYAVKENGLQPELASWVEDLERKFNELKHHLKKQFNF